MKSKSSKTLQIITGVFALLYFALIANAFLQGNMPLDVNGVLTLVLLVVFLAGFAFSWTKLNIAGILIMIWYAGIWILVLYFPKPQDDGAMGGMMVTPLVVIGALLLLEWYKTSQAIMPGKQQQWKFILRILLINYAVLYCMIVFSELIFGKSVDYFGLPYMIFPLLLLIFIVGFILSWNKELYAGLVFLFWCVFYILGAIAYPEILKGGGPWIIFILPVLLQGIFYIKNHFQFKPK